MIFWESKCPGIEQMFLDRSFFHEQGGYLCSRIVLFHPLHTLDHKYSCIQGQSSRRWPCQNRQEGQPLRIHPSLYTRDLARSRILLRICTRMSDRGFCIVPWFLHSNHHILLHIRLVL